MKYKNKTKLLVRTNYLLRVSLIVKGWECFAGVNERYEHRMFEYYLFLDPTVNLTLIRKFHNCYFKKKIIRTCKFAFEIT